MKKIGLKNVIASGDFSIKEAMKLIDYNGIRVAYIVDEKGKFEGVVSDSEIRKAILKGKDISEAVKIIINPDPVVLKERDLLSSYTTKKIIKKLLDRMPDSQYILVLDKKNKPLKLMPLESAIGAKTHKKKIKKNGKRVLVVGGAGYLGSILARKLLSKGFKVRVLDILMYGIQPIEELLNNSLFEFVEGDIRHITTLVRALDGVDCVVNLAAIVGDPACKGKPEDAIETNFLANKVLAEACKYHQINRFLYASTCSVYGAGEGDRELSEESPINPVSLYARSKIRSEEGILAIVDENFSPAILRMGTLYGYSPRMRFDLVVNTMTKSAVVDKRIHVHNGGIQWRPLLNINDAANAFVQCLGSPLNKIKGEIFNVGSLEQNYQIIQIAEIVKRCIPGSKLVIEQEAVDSRNYFVSFKKIENTLKFKVSRSLKEEILTIKKSIKKGEFKDVDDKKYYNNEMQ